MEKAILILVGGLVGAWLMAFVVDTALQRNEIAECYVLQRQAEEIEDFWITDWQRDMCRVYQITVPADTRLGGL